MPSAHRLFGSHYPIDIADELKDEAALLSYLGISDRELRKIWFYRHKMYHAFSISKRRGKVRQINAPDQRLRIIQRKLAPLFDRMYRRRTPVHGFVEERSVKTNAEAHGSRRHVVNLDLKDFFPTITEGRVKGLLSVLGVDGRVVEILARFTCANGHLPQGAPTSPVLSNMICYRLDSELMRVAKATRTIYTRYADDITFSGYQPPSPLFEGGVPASGKFSPDLLSAPLKSAFLSNGFTVHEDKAHYADKNSRRIVTGVKINDGLNVDRRYVRRIRSILHSIEKNGEAAAQAIYAAKGGRGSIEAHLRGKIAYLAHLRGPANPVIRSLAIRFNKSFMGRTIKVTPTIEEQRDRSIWILEHEDPDLRQGTAFFLEGIGLVTADHCVVGSAAAYIYHRDSRSNTFPVNVQKSCKYRDLAILDHKVPESDFFQLAPSSRLPERGDPVVAYGYPGFGPGDQLNVRDGRITSRPNKSTIELIEVSQELSKGMSGGPLIDAGGMVVGVIHKGGQKTVDPRHPDREPDDQKQLAVDIRELIKLSKE